MRHPQRPVISPRPPGSWWRFLSAVGMLAVVAVGIPVGLIVACRASVGSSHPLPGIGSWDEIRTWVTTERSSNEIAHLALRVLISLCWLLWAALVLSLLSAIAGSRPSMERIRIPRLRRVRRVRGVDRCRAHRDHRAHPQGRLRDNRTPPRGGRRSDPVARVHRSGSPTDADHVGACRMGGRATGGIDRDVRRPHPRQRRPMARGVGTQPGPSNGRRRHHMEPAMADRRRVGARTPHGTPTSPRNMPDARRRLRTRSPDLIPGGGGRDRH